MRHVGLANDLISMHSLSSNAIMCIFGGSVKLLWNNIYVGSTRTDKLEVVVTPVRKNCHDVQESLL